MILSAIINLILTLDLFFIKGILVDYQIAGYSPQHHKSLVCHISLNGVLALPFFLQLPLVY